MNEDYTSAMADEGAGLSRRGVMLVGLCVEYCRLLDSATAQEVNDARDFVRSLLGLLPRIYITAFDINLSDEDEAAADDIPQRLDEDQYSAVAGACSRILGQEDTYLDTFSEDMKYSDTPIAASISESLADLYQAFYDFAHYVRELGADVLEGAAAEMKIRFTDYWSEQLCNALRALNRLYSQDLLPAAADEE